jgi:hypothetical protein
MVEQTAAKRVNTFMQPTFSDPLKKREEFIVKLRREKKTEILKSKRKKMMEVSLARTKLSEQ